MKTDSIDQKLLAHLQRDAQSTTLELAELLGLSASQVGRRKQRLEAEGFITHYAARLDPNRLGLTVQSFVQVQLGTHGAETSRSFAQLANARAEIVNAWTMTGEADYLLHIWTHDLAELNALIHGVLLAHPAVARVQSQIVMDQLKANAPLPI